MSCNNTDDKLINWFFSSSLFIAPEGMCCWGIKTLHPLLLQANWHELEVSCVVYYNCILFIYFLNLIHEFMYVPGGVMKMVNCRIQPLRWACLWKRRGRVVHVAEKKQLHVSDKTQVLWCKYSFHICLTSAFQLEFGLTVCPLRKQLGAEGNSELIIHTDWAELPPHNETLQLYKVMLEMDLKAPLFFFFLSVCASQEEIFGWW